MEAHLEAWTREIADMRVHGTTGETPRERFERDEAAALRSLEGTVPFMTARDLLRRWVPIVPSRWMATPILCRGG